MSCLHRNEPLLHWLEAVYLIGLIPIGIACEIVFPFTSWAQKLPFLPLLLTSVYCASGVIYAWLKLYISAFTGPSEGKQKKEQWCTSRVPSRQGSFQKAHVGHPVQFQKWNFKTHSLKTWGLETNQEVIRCLNQCDLNANVLLISIIGVARKKNNVFLLIFLLNYSVSQRP